MRRSRFITILILVVGLSACETLSDSEEPENYPTFIPKLGVTTLSSLNEQYHSKNNGHICSTLNEFGFTGFSRVLFPNDENPCLSREEILVELPYSESIPEIAKQSLVYNSEFTGVENASGLQIQEVISLDGCTICEGPDINNVPLQWKITFSPQKINDIPVSGTEIVVYQDANGVNRIWGNWYKEIVDPGFVIIGSKDAKENLVGEKLRFANAQNQIFEQVIREEHLVQDPSLSYKLIEKENGGEIHKVWEVSVLQNDTDIIRWKVFVSTISDEILLIEIL